MEKLTSRTILYPYIADEARSYDKVSYHDDVIKWEPFQRYWPFLWGVHRSLVNSTHKGQWRGAFSVFFHLRLDNWLSKHSWCWWFETPSCSLWRHCNALREYRPWNVPAKLQSVWSCCSHLRRLCLYSLSSKTSKQMSWNLEAARLDVIMIVSLWNLTHISRGLLTSAAQISERLEKSNPGSRGFETSRDLAVRRPCA